MIKLVTIVFITIIFSGCSMKKVSQPIVKYTIEDSKEVKVNEEAIDKVLKIVKFKSPKSIQNNKIWYKKKSLQTSSYLFSCWNEDFTDMLEKNIADSIYKSNLFKSIFSRYSRIKPDLILESEIIESVQDISTNDKANVLLGIRLYLIDSKNSKLIGSKEFSYTQVCNNVDAKGAIVAYNSIIKNLNKDVVLWLKNLVNEN